MDGVQITENTGSGGNRPYRARVEICGASSCGDGVASKLFHAFQAELQRRGMTQEILLSRGKCKGLCHSGPTVLVQPHGILYCRVRPQDVPELVGETLVEGRVVQRLTFQEPLEFQVLPLYRDLPFFAK